MRRIVLVPFLFLMAATLAAQDAKKDPKQEAKPDPKADKVEQALATLAGDMAKVLEREGQKEVRVGPFTGIGKIPSSFGPEIQRLLIAEFGKRKIAIHKDALIVVSGNYLPATKDPQVPESKEMFLRINAAMGNAQTGLPLGDVSIKSQAIFGNDELARALAPSVKLSPDVGRNARNDELKKSIEKPTTHVPKGEAKVRSEKDSKFAVEVLVVTDAQAADPVAGKTATLAEGLAFVEIAKGECYRIKVHNNADHDVAVRVSIDGIDQFAFSDKEFRDEDGRQKFNYVIVGKGQSTVIKGWFRSLKSADAFKVMEYPKSAAAELSIPQSEVGQICVQFHAAWEKDEDKPKDETGKDAATGRGEKMDVDLKVWKGTVGVMRDQVSVRYTKN